MRLLAIYDFISRVCAGCGVFAHKSHGMQVCLARSRVLSGLATLSILLWWVLPVQGAYTLGVYYYPGWSPGVNGPRQPDPWQPIRAYPEREPLLGWYHDGRVETVERQLRWMHEFGISFVAFDWYWGSGRPRPETSLRAYLRAPSRAKVKYALLWANHFSQTDVAREWTSMVDYWLKNHFRNPEYFQIEGRPVVFIFSGDFLRDNAKASGIAAKELLSRAQQQARVAGMMGIYFVLATPALEYWVKGFAPDTGFAALSAYNYHMGYAGSPATATRTSRSYQELDAGYRMQWHWITENSSLPYFLPMTSGWDKRPWGGSSGDPLHDQSVGTLDEFEAHLRAAKSLMDARPEVTKGMGLICCWNEFGEGSYIEPTKRHGFGHLERIRAVFGER